MPAPLLVQERGSCDRRPSQLTRSRRHWHLSSVDTRRAPEHLPESVFHCQLTRHHSADTATITYIHQAEARGRLFALRPEARAHRARGTARVDEETALHLKRLESVGAAPKQDINIHLSRRNQQRICIAGRDDGVSVSEADTQAAVIYDLGERKIGGVDIVVALDHLQVWRNLAEEVICVAIGQVTQTQDLANLAGG